MKKIILILMCGVLLLTGVGCSKKDEVVEMKLTPRTFSDAEKELIASVSSANLLPYEYRVEERVKQVKLSLLKLDEQGLWQVVKDVPYGINGEKGTLTVEFYPDLVALSSLIDRQPALKAAALQMFEPEASFVAETEVQEIIPGRSIPILMIFGGPIPEGGAKSMSDEGWGDSSVLLAEQARYAVTVTFFD